MRAGLSIWFYIYKDQMASLEMIFDLGRSRSRAKIFFSFCSLFNLLSVYGQGLSLAGAGRSCAALCLASAVGLGVSPPLLEGAAEQCEGKLGSKVLSRVIQGRSRDRSHYATTTEHGNLCQQPLAWIIIEHTQTPQNTNAPN